MTIGRTRFDSHIGKTEPGSRTGRTRPGSRKYEFQSTDTYHRTPQMQPTSDLPLDRPFTNGPSPREAVVQDRPTLGAMPRAQRGVGWWLLPVVDFVSSSVALAVDRPAQPASPSSRRCRSPRCCWSSSTASLGVYGANPSKGGLGSDDGAGLAGDPAAWSAALFAWSASLLTARRPASSSRSGPASSLLDTAGRAISRATAAAQPRPVERWVLVGDEATAERLRAYEPLADYASVVGTVPPRPRTGSKPGRPRRRARGRRALPRRPRRHRQPARRRRGPAGPGPRLQVDRRPGQPAAPPARPARGPGGDAEPGRRRAADRGRGARRPRRRALHGPRPPPRAARPRSASSSRR